MPTLLAPLGLAALAALALPLLIHLLRRPSRQLISFAALRWLPARARPRERLQLYEPVLLVLRLLLIAVLAVLIARPVWHGGGAALDWIGVAPGVDPAAARALIDRPRAQWHWLAPGFPSLAEPPPPAAPVASLIREADAELPAAAGLTLIVPERLAGLDAERPRLGRPADWRIVPGAASPGPATVPTPSPKLSIRYTDASDPQRVVARALADIWQARGELGGIDEAAATVPLAADTGVLIWLGPAPPERVLRWVAAGGTVLLAGEPQAVGSGVLFDAQQSPLLRLRLLGKGRLYASTAALTPAALPELRQLDFPQRLWAVLKPLPAVPARAPAAMLAPIEDAQRSAGPARPLDRWLLWTALLLFAAERWWATRPRGRAA